MMKWWGWGDPNVVFPMDRKPNLWPWIAKTLGITDERRTPPVPRSRIQLPPPLEDAGFTSALARALKPDQSASDEEQRLLHAYGKSYPDLFFARRGRVRRAPDLVLFPESHADVELIVREAHDRGVSLIPFGGGTNIVGCVNPVETGRMIVTIDMARMNRLLALDPYSMTATIEAGALGPQLEKDLQARGFSLGHYPDSFEYSTLGGWLATRSAGMQSDAYGKIEHMVVALKLVTPSGTLATKPSPASSAGPDLNRLAVGSEGVLGVITEAVMRVHKTPPVKDYRGVLFPTFEDGFNAIHECVRSERLPSLIRLQDTFETELAFNMKAPKTGLTGVLHGAMKRLLKLRGYGRPAIMIVGFEGDAALVSRVRKDVMGILKKHRGFDLGSDVGKTWAADKFNLPYLRDFVMDRACMVDVAETATLWSNVLPLYYKVREAVTGRFAEEGRPGFIGCHLSHTYKTGACLYFTYAAKQTPGAEMEQYYGYKKLVTDTFMANGATLSHHHAIGREHRPWMEGEVSRAGLLALRAVKDSLDPKGLLNPGKLLPDDGPGGDPWLQPTDAAVLSEA